MRRIHSSVLQTSAAKNIEHPMSESHPPIYRTHHHHYTVDRCEPQFRAIQEGKIKLEALTSGHYPGRSIGMQAPAGINSIGFWDISKPQDWGLELHRNEGIEITYLETGHVSLTVSRKSYEMRAGQMAVTRPWQLHKLGSPNLGPNRLHWLILDVGVRSPEQEWQWPSWVALTSADLAELTRRFRNSATPVTTATPAIAQAFRHLARCITGWDEPHAISRLIVGVNQLLLGILDAAEEGCDEKPQLASRRRAVELFLLELARSQPLCSEPWTIDTMAEHCGMGVTALSKYCRELVNAGPVEYVNQCRIEHAARQLCTSPNDSVTDIAMRNGFNSGQYFATNFRQRFKISPSEFRKRNVIS